MNLSDRRLWEKIVVAASCVIIISWVVVLVVRPGHRFSPGTGKWISTDSTGCSC